MNTVMQVLQLHILIQFLKQQGTQLVQGMDHYQYKYDEFLFGLLRSR